MSLCIFGRNAIKVRVVVFSVYHVRTQMMPLYLIIGDVNFDLLLELAFARFTHNKAIICYFIILSDLKELNFKLKLSP